MSRQSTKSKGLGVLLYQAAILLAMSGDKLVYKGKTSPLYHQLLASKEALKPMMTPEVEDLAVKIREVLVKSMDNLVSNPSPEALAQLTQFWDDANNGRVYLMADEDHQVKEAIEEFEKGGALC